MTESAEFGYWFGLSEPLRITVLSQGEQGLSNETVRYVSAYLADLLQTEVQIRQELQFDCGSDGCDAQDFGPALASRLDSSVIVFRLRGTETPELDGALGLTIGRAFIILDLELIQVAAAEHGVPISRRETWTLLHEMGHWFGIPTRDCHLRAKDAAHCTEDGCILRWSMTPEQWRARIHSSEDLRFGPLCEEELRWAATLRNSFNLMLN